MNQSDGPGSVGQSADLRTRIAAAIYNASDEYARKLMVRPDCPGASELMGESKPVCYTLADAVIRELNLDISHYYKTSQGREVCIEGFWTEEVTDGTA